MTLGTCYYPEHWPEERWPVDATLMRAVGLEVVRLAEFAWAKMEPALGQYEWGWLDRSMQILGDAGLRIVLGTPTAAPPAWLIHAQPDILPVKANGQRLVFGMRRHYCPNHPGYREHTRRIVSVMAHRYGHHPHVIGWQIDNEWGGGGTAYCYCEHCAVAFRAWLRERYGTLDALNDAWGTTFWSQIYGAWDQIGLPPNVFGKVNPSQALDYRRFMTSSWLAYQQLQIDALREHVAQDHFFTTNFMGLFSDLDYFRLADPLDFVTWDNYPTGHTERLSGILYGSSQPDQRSLFAADAGDPAIVGMAHDLMRSLAGKPFWVMEQQPGTINWADYNPTPQPGVLRLWTWDAVAHGADAVLYFRWRACRVAQEQYHSGLLRHDGQPDQGLWDVGELRQELAVLEELQGSRVATQVALLHSYEDLWALALQPHHRDFSYLRQQFLYYRALQRAGVPVDFVPPGQDLRKYELVIAPTLFLMDEQLVTNLRHYVEQGGHLLLAVRSGFKTGSNLVSAEPLPGLLAPLVGAQVDSWNSLPPNTTAVVELSRPEGRRFAVPIWAETLLPQRAKPLAHYVGQPLDGQVAAVFHQVGAGEVVYLGAWATDALLDAVLGWLLPRSSVASLAKLSSGVKVMQRVAADQEFLLFSNYGPEPGTAEIASAAYLDAFSAEPVGPQITIAARNVRVLRRAV
jgi:beta-galactosidase